MRTPAGKECRYYYEDFHRGRELQECRLIQKIPHSVEWKPRDCSNCPAPDILWANASEHLELHAEVALGILGFGRHVDVAASCRKHQHDIKDPFVGCEHCAAERPNISDFLTGDA